MLVIICLLEKAVYTIIDDGRDIEFTVHKANVMINRTPHIDKRASWKREQKTTWPRSGDQPSDYFAPATQDETSELDVLEEVTHQWPGIVVLAHRRLGDELGVAVYFTFPGGRYMAVWTSGTNQLCLTPEDRPRWETFLSQSTAKKSTPPALLCTKAETN